MMQGRCCISNYLTRDGSSVMVRARWHERYFNTNGQYLYIAEKRNLYTHREKLHDSIFLNGREKDPLGDFPSCELAQSRGVQ